MSVVLLFDTPIPFVFLAMAIRPVLTSFGIVRAPPGVGGGRAVVLFTVTLLVTVQIPLALAVGFPFELMAASASTPSAGPEFSE